MSEPADVYRRLQQHLDRMLVGFPATESGVEIRILQRLFSPEDAEIALQLSVIPETLDRIHRRLRKTGISTGKLEEVLDRLADKGAILGGRHLDRGDGKKRYSKAQLAVGIYEFQVDRLTAELQRDFEQYMDEAFAEAFHTKTTPQLRTIPINESVIPDRRVGTYDGARRVIEESDGPFAVINCICRQGGDLRGEPCRQTEARRVCLTIGSMAQGCIDAGLGQAKTTDETLKLLDRADEDGMVLQPENSRDPHFMCFCCGCCCGVLSSVKKFPRPAEYVHSNYYAMVDSDLCTGCETCVERCQMDALAVEGDACVVNGDRCIGCGLCVSTCPSDAMHLVERDDAAVPPKNTQALYRQIMTERFGTWGTAKIMARAMLGLKI